MKKIMTLIIVVCLVVLSVGSVRAQSQQNLNDYIDTDDMISALPEDVSDSLENIGLDSADFSSIQNVTFSQVIKSFLSVFTRQSGEVLPSVIILIAVLILYSVFAGFFEGVSDASLKSVLSVVSALCIGCVLLFPVVSVINEVSDAIKVSADFMLAFIPVMTAVLVFSGQTVTGSGYASMMVLAAEGVAQLFSKLITPLLSCFLSLSISSSIVPQIKLSGVLGFFSKTIKWFMSFIFTIFTGLLTVKSFYSSSVDSISTRAVRYTMSSFVPVVGSALSEAYRTVHSSIGVLKSGVGIFVIFAVVMIFLPVISKLLLWLLCINLCKTFAEITDLSSPVAMLSGVSAVLSVLLSVVLCIMALFIITTALIITIGGS